MSGLTAPEERCSGCGKGIPRGHSRWYGITGYERPRQEGGTNAVSLRRRTGRVLCLACKAKLDAGISLDQSSLGL
jgi:hypothetical protein